MYPQDDKEFYKNVTALKKYGLWKFIFRYQS